MTRDEIAVRLLCAILQRPDGTVDLYPDLGEKQIRICLHLADTFLRVAHERAEVGPRAEQGGD